MQWYKIHNYTNIIMEVIAFFNILSYIFNLYITWFFAMSFGINDVVNWIKKIIRCIFILFNILL